MERKPTCFDCIHAVATDGHPGNLYEPPEPAMVDECKAPVPFELLEENEWKEDLMPTICGHFSPHMINGKCFRKGCSNHINAPQYSWKHYVCDWELSGESAPVCSDDCRTAFYVMEKLTK